MLPMLLTTAAAGFASGPLTPRMSPRVQVIVGGTVIALSTAAMVIFHAAAWQLAVADGVFGIGFGLAFASMTSVIVRTVSADRTGVATGMNTNLRTICGAIMTAIVTRVGHSRGPADRRRLRHPLHRRRALRRRGRHPDDRHQPRRTSRSSRADLTPVSASN